MKTALKYTDVTIRYRKESPAAVSRVSLQLEAGEKVALLGLNGSGKTTLLHAATGLIPFTGDIEVNGIKLTDKTMRKIRDIAGLLFSTPDDQLIFPNITDDVAFAMERRKIPHREARSRATQILKSLGIDTQTDISPHVLSQGQRQRVALAGIFAASPLLLLLDEPSASLDTTGREELAQILAQQSATILMATHDLQFARRTCERFIILHDGKLHSDSHCPQTVEQYEQECIASVLENKNMPGG
ncbi:MAG: ABC transporter ATP-binding protein [Kiritimatiellia bacterium]